jgi:hypothetical protein
MTANLRACLGELITIGVDQGDGCSCLQEPGRSGQADTTRRAGDDHAHTSEVELHR